MNYTDIVYHYCSIDTFKKIIGSSTLRFSDIMKSNDSKEIIYLWNKYYEYIDKIASNKHAVQGLKFNIKKQLKENIFLALCFSKNSDALHMWNCYADGGIAIGFDLKKLKEWATNIRYYNNLKEYNNGAICTEIKEVDYYNSKNIDEYITEKCKNIEFASDKFDEIFIEAPFSKTNFFAIEKEVRIIIRIFKSEKNSNQLEYYFDIKNNKSIPIKLESNSNKNFDNVITATIPFPQKIIKSITLGPNCRLNCDDIEQILYVNNFNNEIKIEKSKGSYR